MLLQAKDRAELRKILERLFPVVMEWEGWAWEHDLFKDMFEDLWNEELEEAYNKCVEKELTLADPDEVSEEADKLAEQGLDLVNHLSASVYPLCIQVDVLELDEGQYILITVHKRQEVAGVDQVVDYINKEFSR